ncbi:hypothetical protein vBKpnAMK4_00491 [Klebsiella phage vB_Kpn_AM_K4]
MADQNLKQIQFKRTSTENKAPGADIVARGVLYQSCHILQKQGRYYIVHFKEMLKLDGRPVTIDLEDEIRRDSIAQLLADWGLLSINRGQTLAQMQNNFRVITFKQKHEWTLKSKYTIGA